MRMSAVVACKPIIVIVHACKYSQGEKKDIQCREINSLKSVVYRKGIRLKLSKAKSRNCSKMLKCSFANLRILIIFLVMFNILA